MIQMIEAIVSIDVWMILEILMIIVIVILIVIIFVNMFRPNSKLKKTHNLDINFKESEEQL